MGDRPVCYLLLLSEWHVCVSAACGSADALCAAVQIHRTTCYARPAQRRPAPTPPYAMAAAASKAPPAPEGPPSPPPGAKRKTKSQKALAKVKTRFSFVAGLGSSGMRAVEEGSGESVGFWKGLKNAKRRISQQVSPAAPRVQRQVLVHCACLPQALSKIGYGKDSEDAHYKERKARILELQGRYERFSKFLGQYLDSARGAQPAPSQCDTA